MEYGNLHGVLCFKTPFHKILRVPGFRKMAILQNNVGSTAEFVSKNWKTQFVQGNALLKIFFRNSADVSENSSFTARDLGRSKKKYWKKMLNIFQYVAYRTPLLIVKFILYAIITPYIKKKYTTPTMFMH